MTWRFQSASLSASRRASSGSAGWTRGRSVRGAHASYRRDPVPTLYRADATFAHPDAAGRSVRNDALQRVGGGLVQRHVTAGIPGDDKGRVAQVRAYRGDNAL